ncbi:polysaccharide deacetylase family protein [Rummeliibacillus stabekisii]|uniref:polysaccharide deacetylase family protein n=1 Tax=Rummeliibacillus stabekisii TaxID=241244 RepID=UPI00204014A2|nr:polysaccharide deacetylase family protein [Rummeliibacillus stabekisii]
MTTNDHPKKYYLSILILMGIAILALIFFVSKTLINQKHGAPASNPKDKLNIVSNTTQKQTKHAGIYLVTEKAKAADKDVAYTIQFPKTPNKAFNQNVTDSVDKMRDDYLINQMTTDTKGKKSKLTISTKMIIYKKNYYSFVLTQTLNKKRKCVKTFMYDYKNKKVVLLQDIIQTKQNLGVLSRTVKGEIMSDCLIKQHRDAASVANITRPIWGNYQEFALTKNAFIIYYNPGELSKNITGIKKYVIPLTSTTNAILAPPFKKKQPAKKIALTFDDGPSNTVTPKVLRILRKHHAKATFFMLGQQVHKYPNVAKKVYADGHEIGSHSYSHPDLRTLPIKKVKRQINQTNAEIKKATGCMPFALRPPYGAYNKRIQAQSSQPIVLWTVDTLDWKYLNSKKLLSQVKKDVYPGAIVLMHDIHLSTAQGLDAVLTYLEKRGYTFVTVPELHS